MRLAFLSVGQSVLNAAARIVYGGKPYDLVTPLLRDRLHWLRVPERIRFKLCLMVFKALNHLAPEYIMNCCFPVSNTARRAGLSLSVSGRYLAICWTSREHGLNSENVLSLSSLLGPRHGTTLPVSIRTAASVDS